MEQFRWFRRSLHSQTCSTVSSPPHWTPIYPQFNLSPSCKCPRCRRITYYQTSSCCHRSTACWAKHSPPLYSFNSPTYYKPVTQRRGVRLATCLAETLSVLFSMNPHSTLQVILEELERSSCGRTLLCRKQQAHELIRKLNLIRFWWKQPSASGSCALICMQ